MTHPSNAHSESESDQAQTSDPATSTPGRPKDSGSRQQTQPNQNSQTGSKSADRENTQGSSDPKPLRERAQ